MKVKSYWALIFYRIYNNFSYYTYALPLRKIFRIQLRYYLTMLLTVYVFVWCKSINKITLLERYGIIVNWLYDDFFCICVLFNRWLTYHVRHLDSKKKRIEHRSL